MLKIRMIGSRASPSTNTIAPNKTSPIRVQIGTVLIFGYFLLIAWTYPAIARKGPLKIRANGRIMRRAKRAKKRIM